MTLSLVGDNKTRIKVSVKEIQNDKRLQSILGIIKPYKESSRYKYYLIDGNLLNRRSSRQGLD